MTWRLILAGALAVSVAATCLSYEYDWVTFALGAVTGAVTAGCLAYESRWFR